MYVHYFFLRVQFPFKGKKLAKPRRQFYALSAVEKLVCFSYAPPAVMNGAVCLLSAKERRSENGVEKRQGSGPFAAITAACVKVTLCFLARPDGASRPPKSAPTSTSWHWPFAG